MTDVEMLRRATRELVESALHLAAYAEGLANVGTGTRSTARNMARDVQAKAELARTALRRLEAST